jgi:hypothetical protein
MIITGQGSALRRTWDSRGSNDLGVRTSIVLDRAGIGLVSIIAWALLSRSRAAEDRRRDKFLEAKLSGAAEDVLEKKGRELCSEHEPRGS